MNNHDSHELLQEQGRILCNQLEEVLTQIQSGEVKYTMEQYFQWLERLIIIKNNITKHLDKVDLFVRTNMIRDDGESG